MNRFKSTDASTCEELLLATRRGDQQAARELYRRHAPAVFRVAFRLLENRSDAEDVTQDVFVKLYRRFDTFDFRSSFETWLYRITVNACYDVMRKQQRRAKYHVRSRENHHDYTGRLAGGDSEEAARSVLIRDLQRHLSDALAHLHPDLRAALVLRDIENLSYQQIAEVMACSMGTVASRLARAREHAARYLRQVGIDEAYLR